jgi:hypothetical protein
VVILPLLSTIDSRTPRSPHSPQSPKKQTFGPVLVSHIHASGTWGLLTVYQHTVGSLPGATVSFVRNSLLCLHLLRPLPAVVLSTVLVKAPSVFDASDILIPRPVSTLHYFRGSSNLLNTQDNLCYACSSHQWPCTSCRDKRTGTHYLSCVYCTTKKIKCTLANMETPPKRV